MTLTGSSDGMAVANSGIDLQHLSKRYGDNLVLDDVSLRVEPGTVTALIGPSGAGKSTFLRCINLLERPDSGVIKVAHHTIEPGKEATDALRGVYADPPAMAPLWYREGIASAVSQHERPAGWGTYNG